MPDASAYCADLVRTADRDRFLATLFAPAEHRNALHALYAFAIEIGRVREVARQSIAGDIRLQWWREVIEGERAGEAQANPVAAALLAAMERHGLAAGTFVRLIEAHRFDLHDEPMATIADLEAYTANTSSTLFALAAQILGLSDEAAAAPAGMAYGITALLRAFPLCAARHQLYVPAELLDRFGVHSGEVFAGKSSTALNAALGELRGLARRHLGDAHRQIMMLPQEALPAFLPLALVQPTLRRLDRSDAFAPVDLPLWRRQWLLWRAARNPAWIAR
jgi:phytoene synthase